MNKKFVGFVVCILLIFTLLLISAMAGDGTSLEISDSNGDVKMNVDIQKAWFFEDPATPEYLYITIQVSYLEIRYGGSLLNDVYWIMNNETYYAVACLGIYLCGIMGKVYFATGVPWSTNMAVITGSLDFHNITITCIIPKSLLETHGKEVS